YGKPHSCTALSLRGVEWLEDSLTDALRHPDARIFDGNAYGAIDGGGADAHSAALRHRLYGVQDQLQERLPQLGGRLHYRWNRLELVLDSDGNVLSTRLVVPVRARERDPILNECRDVQRRETRVFILSDVLLDLADQRGPVERRL